jgi:hypothetical protein
MSVVFARIDDSLGAKVSTTTQGSLALVFDNFLNHLSVIIYDW